MTAWAQLLHFYRPPTQTHDMLARITDESYTALADSQLQPALHSCQSWWASRRPMWDVPMVHRGFMLLNGVLLLAWKAVRLGDASGHVKEESSWRVAAASVIRARLETILFEDVT